MKNVLLLMTLMIGFSSSALGDVFSDYETIAKNVVGNVRNGQIPQTEIARLIPLGYTIMDLFVKKYPECKEQYAQVRSEDSQMAVLNFDKLNSRYHNGEGLIVAPKHCYLGRSMVVHPYMAFALIREKKDGVADEIEEVARRAPKIKNSLGL